MKSGKERIKHSALPIIAKLQLPKPNLASHRMQLLVGLTTMEYEPVDSDL
jgi:hypothetical protein